MLRMDTDDVTLILLFVMFYHPNTPDRFTFSRYCFPFSCLWCQCQTELETCSNVVDAEKEVIVNQVELEKRQNILLRLESRLYKSRWFFTSLLNCLPEALCVQFKKPRTGKMVSDHNPHFSHILAMIFF